MYPTVAKSLRDINKGQAHKSDHHCCGMMIDGGTGYADLNELMKKPQPLYFTLGRLLMAFKKVFLLSIKFLVGICSHCC